MSFGLEQKAADKIERLRAGIRHDNLIGIRQHGASESRTETAAATAHSRAARRTAPALRILAGEDATPAGRQGRAPRNRAASRRQDEEIGRADHGVPIDRRRVYRGFGGGPEAESVSGRAAPATKNPEPRRRRRTFGREPVVSLDHRRFRDL